MVIFALALAWGEAMLMLLALKVSPDTINALSGYRSAYGYLAALQAQDIGASTRLIAALAGVIACVVFGCLAWRALPRPTSPAPTFAWEATRAAASMSARAIERVAEIAVLEHPAVAAAHARYDTDDVTVHIDVSRADAHATASRATNCPPYPCTSASCA